MRCQAPVTINNEPHETALADNIGTLRLVEQVYRRPAIGVTYRLPVATDLLAMFRLSCGHQVILRARSWRCTRPG